MAQRLRKVRRRMARLGPAPSTFRSDGARTYGSRRKTMWSPSGYSKTRALWMLASQSLKTNTCRRWQWGTASLASRSPCLTWMDERCYYPLSTRQYRSFVARGVLSEALPSSKSTSMPMPALKDSYQGNHTTSKALIKYLSTTTSCLLLTTRKIALWITVRPSKKNLSKIPRTETSSKRPP